MRVNNGRGWVDLGPGSAMGGLTGHRSAHVVALSHAVPLTSVVCKIPGCGRIERLVQGMCPRCYQQRRHRT